MNSYEFCLNAAVTLLWGYMKGVQIQAHNYIDIPRVRYISGLIILADVFLWILFIKDDPFRKVTNKEDP